MNTRLTPMMLNAGSLSGFGSRVAKLASIALMETKRFARHSGFVLAANRALRNFCFAAPLSSPVELGDYPYDTRTTPWDRDGSPTGL